MRTRALTAMALLPLLLGGCGGSSKQSRSEVIKRANTICRQAQADAQSYTSARSSPVGEQQVNAALQKDADIADATVKQLQALDPAEEQKAEFERFVSGLRGIAQGDRRFIKAVNESDRAGAKEGGATAAKGAEMAKNGASAYGLDDCPYDTVTTVFSQKNKAAADRVAAARDPIGSWNGTVTQYGPGAKRYRYRMIMTVRDVSVVGSLAGSVEYPSFPCSGDLQLVARRRNSFRFRERITSNTKECTSGGRITSTVTGNRMGWRWTRKGIEVLGTLRRR